MKGCILRQYHQGQSSLIGPFSSPAISTISLMRVLLSWPAVSLLFYFLHTGTRFLNYTSIDSPESSGPTTSHSATASLTTGTKTETVINSSPTSTSGGAGGGKKSSPNVGAIAGGVVGGIIGLALLGLICALLYRRRRGTDKGLPGPGRGINPAVAGGTDGAAGLNAEGASSQPNMSQYSAVTSSNPAAGAPPPPSSHNRYGGPSAYTDTSSGGGYGADSVAPARFYEYVNSSFAVFFPSFSFRPRPRSDADRRLDPFPVLP